MSIVVHRAKHAERKHREMEIVILVLVVALIFCVLGLLEANWRLQQIMELNNLLLKSKTLEEREDKDV